MMEMKSIPKPPASEALYSSRYGRGLCSGMVV
jgi:hypothetical protein